MRRLVTVVVLAGVFANSLLAEVVQIKPFSFVTVESTPYGTSTAWFGFFSSDSVMNASAPFTLITDPSINPSGQPYKFVWKADVDLFLANRGLSVVGIPETMITDTYTGVSIDSPPPTFNIQRPFLEGGGFVTPRIIDKEVLNGLGEWSWDGTPPTGIQYATPAGYTTPVAEGSFNQEEQRFYISDGRQYQVVPEPSSLSLLALGGVVVVLGRRKIL